MAGSGGSKLVIFAPEARPARQCILGPETAKWHGHDIRATHQALPPFQSCPRISGNLTGSSQWPLLRPQPCQFGAGSGEHAHDAGSDIGELFGSMIVGCGGHRTRTMPGVMVRLMAGMSSVRSSWTVTDSAPLSWQEASTVILDIGISAPS
jgi:hypothetical protein